MLELLPSLKARELPLLSQQTTTAAPVGPCHHSSWPSTTRKEALTSLMEVATSYRGSPEVEDHRSRDASTTFKPYATQLPGLAEGWGVWGQGSCNQTETALNRTEISCISNLVWFSVRIIKNSCSFFLVRVISVWLGSVNQPNWKEIG